MKKAMIYVGITTVSVAVFFIAAKAIVEICDFVYWNTELLDEIYGNDWFTYIQVAFTAIVMNQTFTRLSAACKEPEPELVIETEE